MKRRYYRSTKSKTSYSLPDLSPQQITEELLKCKESFEYFLRYVKIQEGVDLVAFSEKIYHKQLELIRSILKNHYVIVNKSRQIGVSTVLQAFVAWCALLFSNMHIGILSRIGSEVTAFNRKVMRIIDNIPVSLTGHKRPEDRYVKYTEQTFILRNGSEVVCEAVSQSNPENTFRGKSLHLIIIDEAAFIPKIELVYTAIVPATFKAHRDLEGSNVPYGIVIVSTPNGTTGTGKFFYQMWQKSVRGDNDFVPVRIHYSEAPFVTEEWIEKQRKNFSELRWPQEMELIFLPASDGLFDRDVIQRLSDSIKEPVDVELKTFDLGQTFSVPYTKWYTKEKLRDYISVIIGCDVATVYGKSSNTAVEIFGVNRFTRNIEQIGEIVGKFPLQLLETILVDLMENEFKDIQLKKLIHENNSYAQQLSERLMLLLPWEQLFWQEQKGTLPGFTTTATSKRMLLESLFWFVNSDKVSIRSNVLVNDLSGLKRATSVVPDTCISTSLVAYYVQKYLDNDLEVLTVEEKTFIEEIVLSNLTEQERVHEELELLKDKEYDIFSTF